jgi:hypothetical protein
MNIDKKMGLLFKKKEVPDELPSLMSDEVFEETNRQFEADNAYSQVNLPSNAPANVQMNGDLSSKSFYPGPAKDKFSRALASIQMGDDVSKESLKTAELQKLPFVKGNDSGYFKELIQSVMGETEDLEKFDKWWKNSFLPADIVTHMREYWEKQTPELILNNFGGEAKNKLLGKVEKLHGLEKEWQSTYLHLLECEDKIRGEESELKESLSEFVAIYKKTLNRRKK